MLSLDEIRAFVMAFPDVAEGPPVPAARRVAAFKVAGKSFIGLEKGESHLTVSLSEVEARDAVAGERRGYEDIRRGEKFLGLRVDLTVVPASQVRRLIERSWRSTAPTRIVTAFDLARR